VANACHDDTSVSLRNNLIKEETTLLSAAGDVFVCVFLAFYFGMSKGIIDIILRIIFLPVVAFVWLLGNWTIFFLWTSFASMYSAAHQKRTVDDIDTHHASHWELYCGYIIANSLLFMLFQFIR
jgi:hypothetical protein